MKKLLLLICSLQIIFCHCLHADQLIIEPDAGRQPILAAMESAHSSLELAIYGFTDPSFANELIDAQQHAKKVTVMLETTPYKNEHENDKIIQSLKHGQITLYSPNPDFTLLHQKTLIMDQQKALVMTFNFTRSAFKNQRNFALWVDDPEMVAEIDHVFWADSLHQKISVRQPNLVWSPDNAREKILALIASAKTEIDIYAEDLTDYEIVGALATAARDGIKVRVLLSVNDQKWHSKKMAYLTRAGVSLHNSHSLVIHAKMILVDHAKALLGSINLTKPSLDKNRELSVLTTDKQIIDSLTRIFSDDWYQNGMDKTERFHARSYPHNDIMHSFVKLSKLIERHLLKNRY